MNEIQTAWEWLTQTQSAMYAGSMVLLAYGTRAVKLPKWLPRSLAVALVGLVTGFAWYKLHEVAAGELFFGFCVALATYDIVLKNLERWILGKTLKNK